MNEPKVFFPSDTNSCKGKQVHIIEDIVVVHSHYSYRNSCLLLLLEGHVSNGSQVLECEPKTVTTGIFPSVASGNCKPGYLFPSSPTVQQDLLLILLKAIEDYCDV